MKKLLLLLLFIAVSLLACGAEYDITSTRPEWAVGEVNTAVAMITTCENCTYNDYWVDTVTIESTFITFDMFFFDSLEISEGTFDYTISAGYTNDLGRHIIQMIWVKNLNHSNAIIYLKTWNSSCRTTYFLWPYIIGEEL